jgi:hypothetical protein
MADRIQLSRKKGWRMPENTVIDGRRYVECEVCKKFATFDNAVKLGWDWFTGSLDHTHYYCTKHRTSPERNAAFARGQLKVAIKQQRARP